MARIRIGTDIGMDAFPSDAVVWPVGAPYALTEPDARGAAVGRDGKKITRIVTVK